MANSTESLAVSIPPLSTPPQPLASPSSIGLSKLSMTSSVPSNHHSRHHSLSASSTHRVARRKSINASNTNLAAVAAAVKEGAAELSLPQSSHPAMMSRSVGVGGMMHYPSPPSSLPNGGGGLGSAGGMNVGAGGFSFPRKMPVQPVVSPGTVVGGISNGVGGGRRVRRASEGAHALAPGGDDGSGSTGTGRKSGAAELKCDKCGKGYKHSSCLTKHLWEHTPEWSLTSKLLISKHQQVQLLEAASILVSMNPTDSSATTTTTTTQSSGSSSSGDSPPPPLTSGGGDEHHASQLSPHSLAHHHHHHHHHHSTSRLSSSLRSPGLMRTGPTPPLKRPGGSSGAGTGTLQPGSAPAHPAFPSHFPPRPAAHPHRTRTASFANNDESLAAAVELLSCSFGAATSTTAGATPRTPHVRMKIEEVDEEYGLVVTGGGGSSAASAVDEMVLDDDDMVDDDDDNAIVDDLDDADSSGAAWRAKQRRLEAERRRREREEDEDGKEGGVFGDMEE